MSLPCKECDELIPAGRAALGYMVCMSCADKPGKKVTRTVVPMHKSNYVMITDPLDLHGINNKGGFHR